MAYQNPLKNGQDIRDRTFRFACRIVKLCEQLYEAGGVCRPLAAQLVRCGTSVAAMLEEAKAAESRRDFISKCSIGLKEAREAHVRLRIQCETNIGPAEETRTLMTEAHEISCILAAIVRNTKMRQIAKAAIGGLIALVVVRWVP
jgi:four helix bundle protein